MEQEEHNCKPKLSWTPTREMPQQAQKRKHVIKIKSYAQLKAKSEHIYLAEGDTPEYRATNIKNTNYQKVDTTMNRYSPNTYLSW